jgi:hypothetical protein
MSETDNFSHRAGYYADPLAVAMHQARKGGTLAAGEGALLVAEIDRLTAAVWRVWELHKPIKAELWSGKSVPACPVCHYDPHPCETIQALNGDA